MFLTQDEQVKGKSAFVGMSESTGCMEASRQINGIFLFPESISCSPDTLVLNGSVNKTFR